VIKNAGNCPGDGNCVTPYWGPTSSGQALDDSKALDNAASARAPLGTAIEGTDAKASSWNSYGMTNDLLDGVETRRFNGLCLVYGGVLSGWCSAPMGLHCVAKKVPTQCPVGKKAVNPRQVQCGPAGHPTVDFSRPCRVF
jgi:hypothetical protein